jgi:hypothetical protein
VSTPDSVGRRPAPDPTHNVKGIFFATIWVSLASLANFLIWSGWRKPKYLGSDGSLHGPYQPWQVVGLIVMLIVIVAITSLRGYPMVAVVMTTLVMTTIVSVQAEMDPLNDGLWVIGATLFAIGNLLLATLTAAPATLLRRRRTRLSMQGTIPDRSRPLR